MKKILVCLLVLLFCFQILFVSADRREGEWKVFRDVTETDWFYADVKSANELGLINGKNSTDTFLPNDNMTYAEAVKLAACMHELYTTGEVTLQNGTPWYQTFVDYCVEKEIITKEYNYSDLVTRAGYMEIFAKALPDEALKKINSVPMDSIPDVSSDKEYAEAVYKLYRAGILAGVDAEHNCTPDSNIKRCEVAAIVSRMMNADKRVEFTTGDDETIATFGVFSDTHNAKVAFTSAMNSVMKLSRDGADLDGLLLIGDIVYYANNDDIPSADYYSMINSNKDYTKIKNEGKLVFAMGNHEFPLNAKAKDVCDLSKKVFIEEVGQNPEYHTVLEGYHFIAAGPDTYMGELSAAQEQFVFDNVKEALKDGTDKPVFLLLHHPVDNTLYGTSTAKRYSEEFEKFVTSEPRLVVISGHNHYPTADPRSIYQVPGGATFIYTSSIMSGNPISNPYATERHTTMANQGYMIKVNSETNVVTLKRFYVSSTNPTYLEAGDWVLDIPAMVAESKKTFVDTENVYKYTYDERKAKSVMPYFAEGSEVTTSMLKEKRATIIYPVATPGAEGEDNFVGYYKIELYNKSTGETITHKVISDYFLKSQKERKGYTFTGLTPGTGYRVTITPVNMWYIEGTSKLVFDFETLKPEFEEVELDDASTREYSVYEAETSFKYTAYDDYIQVAASRGGTMSYSVYADKPGTYRIYLVASGSDAELRMSVYEVEYGEVVENDESREVITKQVEIVDDKKIAISTDGISDYQDVICADIEVKEAGDFIIKFKKNSTNSSIGLKCLAFGKHK
ncbi:MAG: S-layer homology domain-containing protein [Clostridia bacterium]|nr:S-layer homology domain-containing protein [Clostridia bacterium]